MSRPNDSGPSQTLTLVRHFFQRFFDKESLSPQGEPEADLAQILGLLAVPGAFFVLLFRPFGLIKWDLVSLRYFFVSFSMIVMALITTLQWGALFPDRRDYQILSPLPLRRAEFLLAKTGAIAIFLAVFLVDVNLFSVLLWPGMDGLPNQAAGVGVHLVVLVSSGLFAALASAAVQGVLVTFLSGALLRRVSLVLQTGLLALLVMLLVLIPLMGIALQPLAKTNSPWVHYFPSYWFVGLYERLRPATGSPVLLELGQTAINSLWIALVVFLATYLPGYRRLSRKVLEAPQPRPTGPGPVRRAMSALLHASLLRHPVERAVFHFMSCTIARSMKHRLFLAAYGGFGAALAVMSLIKMQAGSMYLPHSGVAELPLILSFVLVTGLRSAFSVPSELAASWAFQVNETGSSPLYFRAIRKWVSVYALIPLFLILLPLELRTFSISVTLFHLVFGYSLSLLLTEILFLDFRKVPFACSYLSGRANLIGIGVLYVAGFTFYSRSMAWLASWLIRLPWAAVLFFGFVGMAIWGINTWRKQRLATESNIEYEDSGAPTIRTLGLTGEFSR